MRAKHLGLVFGGLLLSGCGQVDGRSSDPPTALEPSGPASRGTQWPVIAAYRAPPQRDETVTVTTEGIVGNLAITGPSVVLQVPDGMRYVLVFPEGSAARTGPNKISFNGTILRDGEELSTGTNVVTLADWEAGKRPKLVAPPATECEGDAYLLI